MSVVALALVGAAAGCGGILGPEYEYEEQVYLESSGAAEIVVDSSVAALVALRGLRLDASPNGLLDRAQLRAALEAQGCPVTRIPAPWRRHGRRFVQIRITGPDIRTLSKCSLLSWSVYGGLVAVSPEAVHYHQDVGAAANGDPGPVNWTGGEVVAFKLHVPSRILDNTARQLESPKVGQIDRGNILTWEQRFADRRAGVPLALDVTMERESILSRTLWLFAGAVAAAVATLVLAFWWMMRRGRQRARLGNQAAG